MIRALLATPDDQLAAHVAGLAQESAELDVAATTRDAAGVTHLLRSGGLDIVLLHEEIGPLPVIDFARELSSSFPDVGLVLIVHEETTDLLRSALGAGVRALLQAPLALEALDNAARTAADLSRSVRGRLEGAEVERRGFGVIGGTMIAVAGAKGGVGTSTVAVHLALAVARGRPPGSVCLVDLDLQAGDLRLLLDLPFKRNIVNLVGLGEELTGGQVDETLYPHSSGLRVLLAPEQGEQSEDVSSAAALQVLGALKFRHEFVIVDVGAVLTTANGLAIKIADQVLVVTTPDIPSLKAANRGRSLWQRMEIRDAGVTAVINRTSKDSEIQPVMVRRTLEMPVADTVLPAAFRALEAPLNTGVPERLEGPLSAAFAKLAYEVLDVQEPERKPRRRRGAAATLASSESGQAATETIALTLIIAICLLGVWQMVLVGYTYVLSGHAAREASRVMAVGANEDTIEQAAREDVTGAWRPGMRVAVRKRESEVAVSVRVPAIIPGGPGAFTIKSTEGAVIENQPLIREDT
jgi:pilus assembly protein CpaE